MITKEMIKQGIDQGVIKFIIDPNIDEGTVCRIGEGWFYFGGVTAEGMNPEEYLKEVSVNDIVDEIYRVLKDNSGRMLKSERKYYEAYLVETLNLKHTIYAVVEHYEDSLIQIKKNSYSYSEAQEYMKNLWMEACEKAGIELNESCWENQMTYADEDDEAYLTDMYGCYYGCGGCNYHIQILEIQI